MIHFPLLLSESNPDRNYFSSIQSKDLPTEDLPLYANTQALHSNTNEVHLQEFPDIFSDEYIQCLKYLLL